MKTSRRHIYKGFRELLAKNFESPENCKNTHQIQFYMQELRSHIQYFRRTFGHVPNIAFYLMNEYRKAISGIQKKEHLLHPDYAKTFFYEPSRQFSGQI